MTSTNDMIIGNPKGNPNTVGMKFIRIPNQYLAWCPNLSNLNSNVHYFDKKKAMYWSDKLLCNRKMTFWWFLDLQIFQILVIFCIKLSISSKRRKLVMYGEIIPNIIVIIFSCMFHPCKTRYTISYNALLSNCTKCLFVKRHSSLSGTSRQEFQMPYQRSAKARMSLQSCLSNTKHEPLNLPSVVHVQSNPSARHI